MDGRADQRRPEVVVGTWLVARAEAPNLVEAMLDGRQPADMTLPRLLTPFPAGWAEQRAIMPGASARLEAADSPILRPCGPRRPGRRRARATPRPDRKQERTTMDTTTVTPDFAAVKQRQRATWAAGDYAVVGTTLQIVGERLCEAVDLRAGERALDVAAGNGNATLAAARRFAEVVSTDYVGALLERGRERAAAERLPVTFREADAEALPFPDAGFDVALSTFGVMFTPDQERAAAELVRVVRPGGRIGLANWTPEGFIGQIFKTIGRHVPPPAGVKSPALWGTEARLEELFPGHRIQAAPRVFNLRYRSAAHWLEVFRTWYGPVHRAFAALDAERGKELEGDILALLGRMDRGGGNGLVVPSEYLEVVVTRR